MTETLRTRAIRAALDTADNIAIAAAAAGAGLTTYRTLTGRPAEVRFTLAAAGAGLAACLADQATTQFRRPLRNRLGVPAYGYTPAAAAPVPAPSREQLAEEVAADAAHRAATSAHSLDRSGGSLTEAANWVGSADGTATCELPGGAHLLCVPSPADQYGHNTRTYLLVRDGEQQIRVSSISELVALLDGPATDAAQPADDEDQADDPWAALGEELAIAELCPAEPRDGEDQADEDDEDDDRDQEAEAHAAGLL
ncbi:hypothetical protein P3T27_006637 [Kitasatospora sp. MAA19]|uniref:hypothetical protein n=1 Tax=Kitasatospora sp. MAA19 TaxID=3035090 RepID=UPI002475202B|nr:hypothetical protein [Kitasatospora sp. MAA19]MDH6709888.1 hypothetical protein [Kitasatospora sp. MAA19]